MPNPLTPILRPLGLDPSQGADTAAAGARAAQGQANSLSDLQWQRQMGGLQQAQGYAGQLQTLYNSLYGAGNGMAAPGGGGLQAMQGPAPGASMTLPPSSDAKALQDAGKKTYGWLSGGK